MQGHVDARRDARGSHDGSSIDEPIPRANRDIGAHGTEVTERVVMGRRGEPVEDARGCEHERPGAHAREEHPSVVKRAEALKGARAPGLRLCSPPPGIDQDIDRRFHVPGPVRNDPEPPRAPHGLERLRDREDLGLVRPPVRPIGEDLPRPGTVELLRTTEQSDPDTNRRSWGGRARRAYSRRWRPRPRLPGERSAREAPLESMW